MIEECKVVNANTATRKIRVERTEHENMVSGEIPIFKGMQVPRVNAFVLCIFSDDNGYVLGELD